jgi:hypothetical protein
LGFTYSVSLKNWLYSALLNNTSGATKEATLSIAQTDIPTCINIGFEVGYNGNTSTLRIYDLWLD